MKKVLSTLILLLLVFLLHGQKFYGGALLGFNGSQIEGDNLKGYHKIGLVAGVWMQTDINESFFWGSEIKYNQKGSRKNPTKFNPEWYSYRMNYIDMPVLVGYRYRPFLSFVAGLSFGYLANSALVGSYGYYPNIDSGQMDNWELSMFAGVKADFDKVIDRDWAKPLIIDLRLNFSAISIHKDKELFFRYGAGHFNNVISTTLYYQINWGKQN